MFICVYPKINIHSRCCILNTLHELNPELATHG